MSQCLAKLRALVARIWAIVRIRPVVAGAANSREFYHACRELAFWAASDAGLDGQIDAFDGSALHPAADGMCTIRMILQDTEVGRSAAEAAGQVVRALEGMRVLLLLEIDGLRFVTMAPNVNLGVRELGRSFTNRTGRIS